MESRDNGENRPIHWSNGSTNIVMSYDRMGRRVTKNDQRFVYDGYLQIANFEHSTSNCPVRGEVAHVALYSALGFAILGASSPWIMQIAGVDGIIQIKGKRNGVPYEMVDRMTADAFVGSIERFDDCSVELVEFRGHAGTNIVFPFINEDFDSTDNENILFDPSLRSVTINARVNQYDLATILGKKMKKNGVVFFDGCDTAGYTVNNDNIVVELSRLLKDVKITGNRYKAFDLRVYLSYFDVEYRPWCPEVKVYINGEETDTKPSIDSYDSSIPWMGNPYFCPLR